MEKPLSASMFMGTRSLHPAAGHFSTSLFPMAFPHQQSHGYLSQKKSQGWLYLIQRSYPLFPGAVTGIEWESLHCQQSKHLLGGLCRLCCTLFPSLCFLTRLGSVMLFLQTHLSYFFPFFSTLSPLSMIRWLCHHSSWYLEAAGVGGEPRVECCRSDPFPHPLGIAGA